MWGIFRECHAGMMAGVCFVGQQGRAKVDPGCSESRCRGILFPFLIHWIKNFALQTGKDWWFGGDLSFLTT